MLRRADPTDAGVTPAERAAQDPDFFAAVAAGYGGRFDPADAIAWLDAPLEPGPSGAVSPAVGLAALRATVYGPDAPAGAAERYERARAAWDGELAAIRAVVAAQPTPASELDVPAPVAAATPDEAQAQAGGEPVGSHSVAAMSVASVPSLEAAPGSDVVHRSRPVWPRFVAGATGVLVVFGAGLLLGSGGGGSAAKAVVSPTATEPSEAVADGESATGPLGMFSRPQASTDRPTAAVGTQLKPASFRLVETVIDLGARAYAAKNTDGDVCLVVVTADSRVSASCTTVAAFAKGGITLDLSISRDPADDSGKNTEVETLFTWTPAGDSVGSFGVTFPASP